jgi:hypothetical protein
MRGVGVETETQNSSKDELSSPLRRQSARDEKRTSGGVTGSGRKISRSETKH